MNAFIDLVEHPPSVFVSQFPVMFFFDITIDLLFIILKENHFCRMLPKYQTVVTDVQHFIIIIQVSTSAEACVSTYISVCGVVDKSLLIFPQDRTVDNEA